MIWTRENFMKKFEGFMKGVNLGGWVSQCGEGNYTKERFDSFIVESDIKKISEWGADHVRLPVDYHLFQNEDKSFKESGFKYIDNCLEWCERYGLNVVLDLHKTMGFIFDDKSYCDFFYNEELQDNFITVWEELTKRYGKFHKRVAFELLNEITSAEFTQKWNEIWRRAVGAIRKINRDVRIIVGGIYNSSIGGLSLLGEPADENVVYTFHCYSPLVFTHQSAYWIENMPSDFKVSYPDRLGALKERAREVLGNDFDWEFDSDGEIIGEKYFERMFREALDVCEKYGVAVYCGEYGVIDRASPEDTVKWFRDINAAFVKYDIPRCVWTYKEKDFGISGEHYSGVIDELVKFL